MGVRAQGEARKRNRAEGVARVAPNLGWGEKSFSPMCSSCALTYRAPTHRGHPAVLKLTHVQDTPVPAFGTLINSERAELSREDMAGHGLEGSGKQTSNWGWGLPSSEREAHGNTRPSDWAPLGQGLCPTSSPLHPPTHILSSPEGETSVIH